MSWIHSVQTGLLIPGTVDACDYQVSVSENSYRNTFVHKCKYITFPFSQTAKNSSTDKMMAEPFLQLLDKSCSGTTSETPLHYLVAVVDLSYFTLHYLFYT